MKKLLALLFFIMLLACAGKKDNAVTNVSGIWVMNDVVNMANFLGVKTERSVGYCLEIDIDKNQGRARLLSLEGDYPFVVKMSDDDKYEIIFDGRSRGFSIRKDKEIGKWLLSFSGSAPLNPGNIESYDGVKSDYQTIGVCIDSVRQDDQMLEQQSKEGDMGNFAPPPDENVAK